MRVLSLRATPGEKRYCQALQVDYWFWERGYEVIPFERDALRAGAFDRYLIEEPEETIVYGAVAVVHDALARARRPSPPPLDLPDELSLFLGRDVRQSSMGAVRQQITEQPDGKAIHIKPRDRQKLFKGRVVHGFSDLIDTSGVADEEPVIVQEMVHFQSEWRATILRGRTVNVAHYKGDPMIFPDPSVLSEGVAMFPGQPIGFGMDWGVTEDGRTLLVEVNDGFALGNYGAPGHLYTAMIECRWRQLMGLADNGVGWEP